jgi:hypothetical protein
MSGAAMLVIKKPTGHQVCAIKTVASSTCEALGDRRPGALRSAGQLHLAPPRNVVARGGRLFFTDIGSSCGSWVNGSKVGMNVVKLSVGDEITLGEAVFLLEENVF